MNRSRPVAIWLVIGIVMIMIQVVLGGITRLTGSGLSITEWQPLLGTIPPLNDTEWQAAFEKYQKIGQYKQINFHFDLQDFKFIYFWEWFHRVWARLIAVAFAIPFTIFVIQKRFRKDMILPMIILFVMGGLQGGLGWIMVKSGLNEENVYVSHIRLAIHFIAALGLLVYALWFALKLLVPAEKKITAPALRNLTLFTLALLVIQLIYGAFMAGLKAAVTATTWPDINGEMLPALSNIFNDHITVQFIHRGLAYVLTAVLLLWWFRARKIEAGKLWSQWRNFPLITVLIQVLLGILTVLNAADQKALLWLGAAHQFTAMLVLGSLVMVLYLLSPDNTKKVS